MTAFKHKYKTGRMTSEGFEFIDTNGVVFATLLGSENDLRMDAVSTLDHITEPRELKDYHIRVASSMPEGRVWELLWALFPERPYTLAMVRTEQEAQNLLDHIRTAFELGWEEET